MGMGLTPQLCEDGDEKARATRPLYRSHTNPPKWWTATLSLSSTIDISDKWDTIVVGLLWLAFT